MSWGCLERGPNGMKIRGDGAHRTGGVVDEEWRVGWCEWLKGLRGIGRDGGDRVEGERGTGIALLGRG